MSGDDKSDVEDRDAKPTAVERPPSNQPHAIGSRAPASGKRSERRASRRSVPPGERYTGGEEIGRGGMGRVVEATDTLLDRRVAVKEALTTDPELLRRFARETKITARLEHPSIVPVYDAGVTDGAPYYVMRRVTGRPLSELIRDAPSLNERLALVPNLLAAAQAIAHAHQRGIIHRDIKPSNILVGDLGETVVIDWGLAKVIGEPDDGDGVEREPDASGSLRTRLGAVFGTPGFMDPSQLRGEVVGPQGDVYSLGASLYNLLAAEPPHYANDSTQMMKLAAQGPPLAVSQLVPGVPAELSTIVDRATDYEVERRYKDAGAFAEELKRFLAGQLVASHRYSATERFVRFVRKHRAAVAIGGAATVLLLVVGAFAVSQVVGERDRADEQARLATQGRHEAEAATAMAGERADQLLISRARALVETNPTAAMASLKLLSPTSKRMEEARAIASAARIRGVAWAMKAADTQTTFATLDQSALRLAQMTTDGMMHVYDLDARRTVFEVDIGRGAQPRWILDGKFVVVGARGATRMFDASGKEHKTDIPDFTRIETDERGVKLVVVDAQARALRIDLEKQTSTVLAGGAHDVGISRDGRHAWAITDTDFTVFDQNNTAMMRRVHGGHLTRAVIARTKIAILDGATILEAPLVANAKWKTLLPLGPNTYRPYWLEYANDRLFATYTDSRVFKEHEGTMREVGHMDMTTGGMEAFASDYLTVGSDGRKVYYVDGSRMRDLYLPIALRYIRLVARRAHPRVVAVGDGAIVVIDLETLPQHIPLANYQMTLFMSDRVLLSSNSHAFDYAWYDLVDRRATQAATNGATQLRSYDREQGRALVLETSEIGRRGLGFRIGELEPSEIIDPVFDQIQLVGGGGLIYASGNKVHGGFTGSTRPELFSMNGTVHILVRLGGTRFAAVSEHELVRGDLRSGAIERLALPDGPEISYASSYDDDVVFARDKQIWRWTATKLVEVITLESDADFLFPLEHGLLAQLANHAAVLIGRDGKVTRLASTRGIVLASPQRVIVPGQFRYDVIELPSFARWSLPIDRSSDTADVQLDLSPNGQLLIERGHDGRLWLWRLPVTEDFRTSLNATNLSEDPNGLLLWPWQTK